MKRGIKALLTVAISIGLLYPAMATAKKPAHPPVQGNVATVHGKVVHGIRGIGAKLWINPQNKRGPLTRPKVNGKGGFTATLKPGTYVFHAQHRGVGQGHVATHLAAGQTLDLFIPLVAHRHVQLRQVHRLGLRHLPTKQPDAPEKKSGVPLKKA